MAIYPGQSKPVPTFPPRPHIIPLGSIARENMRDTAERNINNARTRTRTNFVLILDLMRPSVNRWSSLTHGSHYTITSWPAAATQTRPRVSSAMQPIARYFYTGCSSGCNPPYLRAAFLHTILRSTSCIMHECVAAP